MKKRSVAVILFLVTLFLSMSVHAADLRILDIGPMMGEQKAGGYYVTSKVTEKGLYLRTGKTLEKQKVIERIEEKNVEWWHVYVATDGKQIYYFSEKNSDSGSTLKSVTLDGKKKTAYGTFIKNPLMTKAKGSLIYFGLCRNTQSYLQEASPEYAFDIKTRKLTLKKDGFEFLPGKGEFKVNVHKKSLKGKIKTYTVKTSLKKPDFIFPTKTKSFLYLTVSAEGSEDSPTLIYRMDRNGKTAPKKLLTLKKGYYTTDFKDDSVSYVDIKGKTYKYTVSTGKREAVR